MRATNAVLNLGQARQITGGRKPLVPIQYETACNAIAECLELDEAKIWSDKADVLAAWAKMYHEDEIGTQAKRLKLKAFRRMGELAEELRPHGRPGNFGSTSVLKEHGLSLHNANAANLLARMPERKFDRLIERDRPPSPLSLLKIRADAPAEFNAWLQGVYALIGQSLNKGPASFARSVPLKYAETARAKVLQLIDWLDAFEAALPKAKAQ